jgi:hypothetical protein
VKFIFADAMDMVDPRFDFTADESAPGRKPYWDDQYPHELLGYAPYDGVLVSRGIVGDHKFKGKYSTGQSMRFSRVGAREFLRLKTGALKHLPIFGDCGAFSYVHMETPPYTPEEIIEFYEHGGFTHGCSVDHVIFEFDKNARDMEGGSESARNRFEITLEYADKFLKAAQSAQAKFIPMGVVQGWSPGSKAESARRLESMGYKYIAIGGMVPLNAISIHECLKAIREKISHNVQIHLLGFAKAEQIHEFTGYGVSSFDTTSPLLRAFKDSRRNYYALNSDQSLCYYTAIRVPQALESNDLNNAVKAGLIDQEQIVKFEVDALSALRAYDKGRCSLEEAVSRVMTYSKSYKGAVARLRPGSKHRDRNGEIVESDFKLDNEKALRVEREQIEQTLRDAPWKRCACPVCAEVSIEAVIFRGNNRNRRRGFHNLSVFQEHVKNVLKLQVAQ